MASAILLIHGVNGVRPVFTTAKRNLYAPKLFALRHNRAKHAGKAIFSAVDCTYGVEVAPLLPNSKGAGIVLRP